MSIHGKFVSQLTKGDILNLIKEGAPEDAFLEFKRVVLDPRSKKLDKDRGDLVADFVAFANAQGGHLIVGVETVKDRASQLVPMTGDQAKRISTALRDLAIVHVKPPISQLEVLDFPMDEDGNEWIVISRIPEGGNKPHMSAYQGGKRFTIRTGARIREMTYDEISRMFLAAPQQEMMARFLAEIHSIKSLVEDLATRWPK